MKKLFIKNTVAITGKEVMRNGENLFHSKNDADFLKEIYKEMDLRYPKFFKMDTLSKLAFLATEILFSNENVEADTALVFSNSDSSLGTDMNFQQSMESFPSPSLFVYTLPNIALGEISIRHQLHSENAFFVSETLDENLLANYTTSLFQNKSCTEAVCGWLDLYKSQYDVFLWHIAEEGSEEFSSKNLRKSYLPKYE